jgi:hypothetical protein
MKSTKPLNLKQNSNNVCQKFDSYFNITWLVSIFTESKKDKLTGRTMKTAFNFVFDEILIS